MRPFRTFLLGWLLPISNASSETSDIDLAAALPQSATNGVSQYGTLQAPILPNFLNASLPPNTFPWGSITAQNTNPYTQSPTTGRVRYYDFTIRRGTIAPDGYQKEVMLINNQFPGPLIQANFGDTIVVNVNNRITGPEEGTSLHWHGILQTGSQWEDGVPAVQQCPIPPGKSLQYTFKADLYGTSWYHSHYSAQYASGLFGPMVIYGPKNVEYDIDLGPVMLSDYYHKQYFDIVADVMGTDASSTIPKSDNNLINGKMVYNCSLVTDGTPYRNNAGLSKFKFQTGKKHRLRLINPSAEAIQQFSIDGHTMTVMANDFVPIQPYETNTVTLGVGQRSDVIVEANGKAGDVYWMRSTISTKCSGTTMQGPALAVVLYPRAQVDQKPTTIALSNFTSACANVSQSLLILHYLLTISRMRLQRPRRYSRLLQNQILP